MRVTSSNSAAPQIPARRYSRSSSFQMALLFTVLCGAAVAVLGYFSYYFSRGHFIHSTETLLDAEIRHAVLWEETADVARALDAPGRVFLLLSPARERLAGNLRSLPDGLSRLAEGTLLFELNGRRYAARVHTFDDGRRLLAGVDISEVGAEFTFLRWLSLLSIVLMLAVIVASYLIASFVVTRTNRIARTAKEIMDTGDLSRRIGVDSRWDDLSFMAGVLNQLLARIEQLMQDLRQVADNIAHDLRTPLTRMRNRLESLKKDQELQRSPAALAELERLGEESDQLLRTFNAILQISRIESGRQRSVFRHEELRGLVQDALELYEPLAEEKRIALRSELGEASCRCDRDLLFQAFANLLDNAVKFTPEGGSIEVRLEAGGDGARFIVRDSGPGVPPQEREQIFKRFYRGEQSRHTPGNGLGLSLVAAVVELHGGTLSLGEAAPGLEVSVTLPSGED